MKVLFLALETYSFIGGIQQFNRRIINALSQLTSDQKITSGKVILKGDNEKDFLVTPSNIKIIGCGSSKLDFVLKGLHAFRCSDVVLLGHVNLLPFALLAKTINPKIRVQLFVHGIDVWGENSRPLKITDPFLIKFVDKIASVSAFTAQKMSESFNVNIDKFIVFPNAVDRLKAKVSISSIGKKPLLLTVARLSENEFGKHHDSVLKALPKILKEFPELKYRVIGDGVLKKDLQKLAESLGVVNSVEFKGRVSDEDLAKAYEESSVFVMPSEKEGFGIVFLEAWLRYIPVICGTEDASHEVVSNGIDGFAINHNDINGLSEKIIYLLKNPDQASSMGKLGNKKVKENYLMSNFTENLANLLKKEGLDA